LLGWTDKLMHGLTIATSFWLTTGAPPEATAPAHLPQRLP
jgi:hypothetical protein